MSQCAFLRWYDAVGQAEAPIQCRERHFGNAVLELIKSLQDAVGIQRGLLTLFRALKFGEKAIRSGLRSQLGELAGDASDEKGMAGDSIERKYPSKLFAGIRYVER